jgi:hypothetical protein
MGSTLSGTASNALNSTLSTGLALDPASLATAPRSLQPFLGRAAAQMNGVAPSSQEYSATHAQRIGVASTSSQKRPLSMLLSARSERSMRGMSAAQKTGSSARRRLLPPSAAGAVGAVTDLDRAQTQDEYDAYLRSPFSFIDKVIENPFTEEFVYLRSADGPYDLEIVSHSQIDRNDYHTMSRAGVTHFYKGDTEFTALDQWEREYFLHTRMMEVNFFKKFRAWKAYV